MASGTLHVWLDRYGRFEHVGTLEGESGNMAFKYDEGYSMPAISLSLPIQAEEFSEYTTRAFFSGLTPEGGMREFFMQLTHAAGNDYSKLLERLNDESLGALVFSAGPQEPGGAAGYEPIPEDLFAQFAANPTLTASRINNQSRLSLTGAMAKVGLYLHPHTGEWYIPYGSMPSTHIVKAASDSFPYQTVNEALCMEAARLCGFDVPGFHLMAMPGSQPLFVIERYDRRFPDNPLLSRGCPEPQRLHQEDFGQATSVVSVMKYEPADGNYFNRVISCASTACEGNAYGEAQLCVQYQFFNYLIGNCDNHLKNHSLLYAPDLSDRLVAPLYDVTCTTVYGIDLEMGVSFGGSRRITDVTRRQVTQALRSANRPVEASMRDFDELAEILPGKLRDAAASLADDGFEAAIGVAGVIAEGVEHRRLFDGERGPSLEEGMGAAENGG